ncbi:MAG TPA: TetR/AcrR family transcriptional regulator [Candidatus Cloacimonadota bacterium]|jgi:TetR/AcrR family fatty acid metabolism transcriptional regulator|nr:TetR/AcrR family transcriptional regulator [Candidatus Cloacimonadales bacterium]HPY95947.1 TetR/AcrR family transcriptional regulator [Candidatus Cloacimonadota bacterium]HQB40407.1 TetR/AcrR family transcriptional regulator [Candidatus Cloacimonadota bacterium]
MAYQKKNVELKKASKRRAIYQAAIENFANNGFHKTSMSDIAKSAGVADGTLYLYFKNKDDLLITVFNEMVQEKIDTIKAAIASETNPLERLYAVFKYHIDLFTHNYSYVKFFVQEVRQSPEFYERYPDFHPINQYLVLLKGLLDDCVAQGYMKEMNTELAAKILYGSVDFILSEWSLNKEKTSLDNVYKSLIDIFHEGMKKE